MSNQKRRITKSVVAEAKPAGREYIIWDTAIAGYGLRVRPSGAKSYIFTYRSPGGRAGRVRRVTIGAADKLNAEVARVKAKALAGQHHGGGDPAADAAAKRQEAAQDKHKPTVADLLDRFITDHARESLKPKTWSEYERLVDKILKPHLGKHKVDALEPKHVAEMHHALRAKPTQAALAVRVLSSAMSWAEQWGFRPAGSNPARIRLKGTRRRERLFSDGEVSRLLKALDELEAAAKVTAPVALGIRLLFATGCRAGEICDLRWSGVDLEEGFLRWEDSKTGIMTKAITDEAAQLLEAAERTVGVDYVCPSAIGRRMCVETLEAGFERVMRTAKVPANENASLHLIRHWFATRTYTDKSIPLPLAMAIVGHKSVATAMRYAHVGRDELQRATRDAAKRRAAGLKAAEERGQVVKLRS